MDLSENERYAALSLLIHEEVEDFEVFVNEIEENLIKCCEKINSVIEYKEKICQKVKENIEEKKKDLKNIEELVKSMSDELNEKIADVARDKDSFEKCKKEICEMKEINFKSYSEDYQAAKKKLDTLKYTVNLYINISKIKWDSETANTGKILKANKLISFKIDETLPKQDTINKMWSLICN